jgi:hypothetical protein
MLLASPRWENCLLHFLDQSGVGRTMENGEDEEERRAARLDGGNTEKENRTGE